MDPRKNSAEAPIGGNSSEVTVQPEVSAPKRQAAVRRFTLGFRTAQRLPKLVWLLGLASLFNDVSSEAIFPLLPLFLAQLGAPMRFIGLIEGSADALASIIKMISGRLSDRGPRRVLVTGGYTLPALARAGIALAAAPWHVLTARLVDRAGKGIRSGPRDAMIADSVDPSERGRAFGLNRSMDHLGAAVGPLIASALVALGVGLRATFAVAAALGLVAPVLLALRLREQPHEDEAAAKSEETAVAGSPLLRRGYSSYLAACVLFALGNSSDAFLIIRAAEVGWKNVPLLWFFHHLVKSAAALPGGALSDRHSRAVVVASGWVAYALTYVGFGFASSPVQIVLLFLAYALYHGLAEGAERAIIADLAERGGRGRAFGLYHGFVGVAALPAGLVTGLVWDRWGARWALGLNATCAALAAGLLFWLAFAGPLRRSLISEPASPVRAYPRREP
jgi:MFS family permease